MAIYLDYEKLKQRFEYNPTTGIVTQRKIEGVRRTGVPIGGLHYVKSGGEKKEYLRFRYEGRLVYLHRIAWVLMTGEQPDEIDHIDGNGLNNKWDNLRNVSHKINCKNQKKHKTNTSGYSGVTYRKDSKRWRARIMVDDKMISLGTYKNKQNAVKARKEAEIKYGFRSLR